MSGTTICRPWTEPGSVSMIPVPMVIEHAEPGGVSCTKRIVVADPVVVVEVEADLARRRRRWRGRRPTPERRSVRASSPWRPAFSRRRTGIVAPFRRRDYSPGRSAPLRPRADGDDARPGIRWPDGTEPEERGLAQRPRHRALPGRRLVRGGGQPAGAPGHRRPRPRARARSVRSRWPGATGGRSSPSPWPSARPTSTSGWATPTGPIFLSVVVALFAAVQAGHRRATWALAAAGYAGFVVAYLLDPRADGGAGAAPPRPRGRLAGRGAGRVRGGADPPGPVRRPASGPSRRSASAGSASSGSAWPRSSTTCWPTTSRSSTSRPAWPSTSSTSSPSRPAPP